MAFAFRSLLLGLLALGAAAPPVRAQPAAQAPLPGDRIVATVNGEAISSGDVENRARLFVLSTGMRLAPDIVDRLRPQILRQLVDERLRMQEAQRRKVFVPDAAVAQAIRDIEQRNGMPQGALRARLSADGVGQRTLVGQIRAQIAWNQVLRDQLGERANVSESDVLEQERIQAQMTGGTEYRMGEIFIPIDNPANTADAQRFADTVIAELRRGAPFPIAAQFSQSAGALEGGDQGWLQASQMNPAIAALAAQMPPGAVANPVKVPGGFSIVTLMGKRDLGRTTGVAMTARQVFLPFTSALNPQAPTDQQKAVFEKAKQISATARGCEAIEALARENPSPRPADPGEIRLDAVQPPQFRNVLANLPIGKPTEPLVGPDGIAVLAICSREQKAMSAMSRQDIQRYLLNERVELLSRQLLRDLRRQATIQMRA
jgi:peptidyl-prolyl cis-trans isomerase SurA